MYNFALTILHGDISGFAQSTLTMLQKIRFFSGTRILLAIAAALCDLYSTMANSASLFPFLYTKTVSTSAVFALIFCKENNLLLFNHFTIV